jgi:hypothetical protein
VNARTLCCRFPSRVAKVGGNTLTLERPLPWDLFNGYKAELHAYAPKLHDFGVEGFSVTMKSGRYGGHFK